MVEEINTAYSDDGQRHRRIFRTDDLNHITAEIQEPDTGVSITAELSDHRVRCRDERPDEDDAIYEQPNESENASSPPGSIKERQDIMSENIKPNFKKLGRGVNKPFTQKLEEDQTDEDVSKEAHRSEVTKVSAVAAVSAPIAVPDTSRSIQNFNLCYDRLFQEF